MIRAIALIALLLATPTRAADYLFDTPLPNSYPGEAGYTPQYLPPVCDAVTRVCVRPR
jgi:hypothetical protein